MNREIIRKAADGAAAPSVLLREKENVPYLYFPMLEECKMVRHLFTTRLGGVSKGIYSTMNLSFVRGDEESDVFENYRRIARVMDCQTEDMVCSHQTHTVNIRKVTGADRGKGLTRPRDYENIDGLVTNEKKICLALFFADCVPVFFADPVKEVIGLAHSGWRGTAEGISGRMIELMKTAYDCNPKDIRVGIGPSICQDCYEVSGDVAEQFRKAYPQELHAALLAPGKETGKYQLNLWEAVRQTVLAKQVMPEHIAVTDICTCCNPELLFSHRASHGKRGNLGAFMKLI